MRAGTLAAQAVVIAKEPVPGRVKTRLTPPFTPAEAALLAEAALADTLAAVAAAPVSRHVLALDGAPADWLPAGFDVIPQRGGGLDERLAAAFADTHATLPLPMVLVGMDTPPEASPPGRRQARARGGSPVQPPPRPACRPAPLPPAAPPRPG